MSFSIRRYHEADLREVWKLYVEGLVRQNAYVNDPSLDEDLNDIEHHYFGNHGDFIVGIVNGQIVGMGAFRKKSHEIAEIKRIRVDQDFQRKGYGQNILKFLETSAREKGYRKLVLDTTSNQIPAQRLFTNNGYTETYRKYVDGLEVIFYEKELVGT